MYKILSLNWKIWRESKIDFFWTGYTPPERHEANSQDDNDDYEVKSFKAPPAEGDFKPSTSFPFKEYDEKFGRYSNRDKLGGDEKSVSKNRDYSSDDDDESSARYLSEDTSSKAYYDRQEEEEGETYDDKPRDYERRKTKEERDENAAKYYDKNFDEEFDASYKAKLSKQSKRSSLFLLSFLSKLIICKVINCKNSRNETRERREEHLRGRRSFERRKSKELQVLQRFTGYRRI